MHKEDLKRMSPLWLKYAEDVRFDPDVSFLCAFKFPLVCFCLCVGPPADAETRHLTSCADGSCMRLRFIIEAVDAAPGPPNRQVAKALPQAWNLTGDVFSTHPGDKPWISEMYGYSFGAAKANVWHKYHTTAMIYPGYQPVGARLRCGAHQNLQHLQLRRLHRPWAHRTPRAWTSPENAAHQLPPPQ